MTGDTQSDQICKIVAGTVVTVMGVHILERPMSTCLAGVVISNAHRLGDSIPVFRSGRIPQVAADHTGSQNDHHICHVYISVQTEK